MITAFSSRNALNEETPVVVIGGGLAGCEAAWQLACRDVPVLLYDMKPKRFSPAHRSPHLAELVCSNSLRSNDPASAVGLLKEEMRRCASLIMEAADNTAVPAGKALAVDRSLFSLAVEERLTHHPLITVQYEECREVPERGIVIIATGPLTSSPLADAVSSLIQADYLSFYDAIAPIIEGDSIDDNRIFRASRYDTDSDDYINCPMTEEEYHRFYHELTCAETVPLWDFENARCFEGCLPIEVLADRGEKTLLFGPMKPVGLVDPRTGRQPFAVVQLRKENRESTLFNIVGFQTKLTRPEQKRIFSLIPGLEEARFARYGAIHRNTFINAPRVLTPLLQFTGRHDLFFAGQITGVEGYVESTASGLLAGLYTACLYKGSKPIPPPRETALGALTYHIASTESTTFQPMNVNFGLFPPLGKRLRKRERGTHYARRALDALDTWLDMVSD